LPVGKVKIDPAHPLANGLILFKFVGSFDRSEVVNFGPPLAGWGAIGSPVAGMGQEGPALTSGAVNYGPSVTNNFNLPQTTGTVSVRLSAGWSPTDGANHVPFWVTSPNNTNAEGINAQKYSDNNWYVGWNTSADRRVVAAASGTFIAGEPFNLTLTYNSGSSGSRLYLKGVQKGSNASLPAPVSVIPGQFSLGNDASSNGAWNSTAGSAIYYVAIWNRVLSADEAFLLDADPYGFLIPDESELPAITTVAPSVSKIYTRFGLAGYGVRRAGSFAGKAVTAKLDAASGVYGPLAGAATPVVLRHGFAVVVTSPGATYAVIPGVTVNLKHSFKVVVASPGATYAVAPGVTVNLKHGFAVVVASPGATYAVTPGVTVNLKHGFAVVASPGASYALVGQDAIMTKLVTAVGTGYTLVPAATPVVLRHGFKAVVASPGATYAVTPGVTVNLRHTWKLIPATPGVPYVLVGQDATPTKVVVKKVDAASGVYGPLVGAATPIALLLRRKLDATVPVTYTVVQPATPVVFKHSWKLAALTPVAPYVLVPATTTNTLRQRKLDATTPATYGPLAGQAATLFRGKSVIATPAGVYGPLVGSDVTLRENRPLVAGPATPGYVLVAPATPVLLTYRRKVIVTSPGAIYSHTVTDVGLLRPTTKVVIASPPVPPYLLTPATTTNTLLKHRIDVTTVPQYQLIGSAQTSLTYRRQISPALAGTYGPLTGAATPIALLVRRKLDAATPAVYAVSAPATPVLLTYRRKVIPTPAGVYGPLAGQDATLRKNKPLVAGVLAPPYTLVPAATPAVLRINMPLAAAAASPGYVLVASATPVVLRVAHRIDALPKSPAYLLSPGATVNLTKLANNLISATPSGSYALTPATTTNLRRNLPLVAAAKSPGYLLTGQAVFLTRAKFMTMTPPSPPYVLTGATTTNVLHKWRVTTNIPSYALVVGDPVTLAKGGAQQINPPLYDDPDQFFTHSITIFQSINPDLFMDPDQFFTHSLAYTQLLAPDLFLDPDQFFTHAIFVFYGDTEVIEVPYEDRCMVMGYEDREMIQHSEDRAMEVLGEETDMDASPRKRRA
jgi:hypothetical protein